MEQAGPAEGTNGREGPDRPFFVFIFIPPEEDTLL